MSRQKSDLAISWGKPVCVDANVVGYVTISDRGWGGFDPAGNLIATAHSEDGARRAVLAASSAVRPSRLAGRSLRRPTKRQAS
jgi:hypothetical protein